MKPPPAFLLSALAFSAHCKAATDAPAIPDPVAGFGQMLFGLAIVLGILAASVWLLKRFSSPVRGNGLLRVLGITAVGPREKVVLLEVGEKVLMLGVTPNNVRTLHVFERGELPLAATSAADPVTTLAASFANRLTLALNTYRTQSSPLMARSVRKASMEPQAPLDRIEESPAERPGVTQRSSQ